MLLTLETAKVIINQTSNVMASIATPKGSVRLMIVLSIDSTDISAYYQVEIDSPDYVGNDVFSSLNLAVEEYNYHTAKI